MDSDKDLLRARIELDYKGESVRCNYYPNLAEESTLLEINGREYPAIVSIKNKPNSFSFIIKIDVCKDEK
jgi:hypothetical protein